MMNELEPVILAVKKELDVNTTPDERLKAQQFCAEFKEHPRASWFAFFLMHGTNEPAIRHFGEHVLEYIVRYKWNSLPHYKRVEIRNGLLGFLKAGTKDMMEEQGYIKEKIATVVVEIAKREWLRTWKTLEHDFEEIARQGETQIELILITYRTLAEGIHIFHQDTPKNTIRMLSHGLRDISPQIMKFIYKVLETYYTSYKHSLHTSNQQRLARDLKLIISALRVLQAFIEWIPLKILEELSFWSVLCFLLQEIPIRIHACECLVLVLDRKEKSNTTQLLFLFDYLPQIAQTVSVKCQNFEQDYLYDKRLCQALTLVGIKQVSLFGSKIFKLPPNFPLFLDLMIQATSHQSFKIASFSLIFWGLLLKHRTLSNQEWITRLCEQLFNTLDGKVLKLSYPETQSEFKIPVYAYISSDFDSKKEFSTYFAGFRSKVVELQRKMTMLRPALALHYLELKVKRVVNGIQKIPTPMNIKEFESVCCEVDVIVPTSLDTEYKYQSNSPIVATVETIFKILFDFNPTDPVLAYEQLQALTSFGIYYQKYNPTSVEFVLTRVIAQLTFTKEGELNLNNLSKITIKTRRKAAASLLKLCNSMPTTLLPYLPQIGKIVQDLLKSDKLMLSEQVPLFKALVYISNGMKNFEKQQEFLSELLVSIKSGWMSTQTSNLFRDLGNFLSSIGIGDTPEDPLQIEHRRSKLYCLVHVLYVVWKHTRIPSDEDIAKGGYCVPKRVGNINFDVNHPLAIHDAVVLPNFLNLIQLLHQLWTPPVKLQLSDNWKMLYIADEMTVQTFVDKESSVDFDLYFDSHSVEGIKFMRNLLLTIREWCYEIVGVMTYHGWGFYTIPDLPALLQKSVFCHLEHIENNHLESLIKQLICPLFTNLPIEMYDQFIPILFQTCMVITGKLCSNWAEYKHVLNDNRSDIEMFAQKSKREMSPDELQEIIKEKMIRDATRSYVYLITKLLLDEQRTSVSPSKIYTYISKHPESLFALLGTMVKMLTLEDSSTITGSINFFIWIVPILVPISMYEIFTRTAQEPSPMSPMLAGIFGDVVRSLLVALTWERMQLHQSSALTLMCLVCKHAWSTGNNLVMDIIQTLPNVEYKNFKNFQENFIRAPTDKGKKSVLKSYLSHVVGMPIGSNMQKMKSNILEMPDSFFINQVAKKTEEDLPLEYITQLFDKLGET